MFDSRFSSDSKATTYDVDQAYVQLAEEGSNFIATQMSEARDFIQ